MKTVNYTTESLLTCPECSHQKMELMPTDSCLYYYECEGCKNLLKPLSGDCCVFCSFGSANCPPKQIGSNPPDSSNSANRF